MVWMHDALSFSSGSCADILWGHLQVRISKKSKSMELNWMYSADASAFVCKPIVADATILEPQRIYQLGDSKGVLHVQPMVVDKPVMISLTSPLVLLPYQNYLFYLSLPVSMGLFCDNIRLWVRPLEELSRSWNESGSDDGVVTYFLRERIHDGDTDREHMKPWYLHCPVLIKNDRNVVKIKKICIDPRYLAIYRQGQTLWSNQVIVYTKETEFSRLAYSDKAPVDRIGPVEELCKADLKEKGLAENAFSFIKHLAEEAR